MSSNDLSQFSMADLFRVEAESQVNELTQGLLAVEKGTATPKDLEAMMRAAHSLKGAARIVGIDSAVAVAHAMEDCFVAVQKGTLQLTQPHVDTLLTGIDLLTRIAGASSTDPANSADGSSPEVGLYVNLLRGVMAGASLPALSSTPLPTAKLPATAAPNPEVMGSQSTPAPAVPPTPSNGIASSGMVEMEPSAPHKSTDPLAAPPEPTSKSSAGRDSHERVLRVKAEHVNRMLGLAGESLVESRWLRPFGDSLLRLKEAHSGLASSLHVLQEKIQASPCDDTVGVALAKTRSALVACQELLANRYAELDMFDRRSSNLSHRLYHEALACRMRPFSDGLRGFPRMVRDVARTLGKEVQFKITGEATQVDRDILEKLEAPLMHLVRNAIDHGLETPQEREQQGKSREGTLTIEARHSAGRLVILVAEDGRGIEIDRVRRTVVKRGLTTTETAARLSDSELLEFLFLPGFSVKEEVTEISGRGVGLDVVQSVVKSVRGTIRVASEKGRGTRFQLQLPLTLSVLRTLLVRIGGEPYAFPLAHVLRTLKLSSDSIESMEGRQHFQLEGRRVGLLSAHQVFGCSPPPQDGNTLPVVVLGEINQRYGIVVDQFLGERELVVQPLDPRLGKVRDISSGSVMEDGSPVLIVDVEDLVRSIEKLADTGALAGLRPQEAQTQASRPKRVLVVDDSLTVRELERKLLVSKGYDVEVAVDGADGWNVLRESDFDLVISDVDMPRMDGIEFITMMKKDPKLRSVPAMIVSYKDREDDRRRGLEAGADYYLSKGSFHDDTLLRAVNDLIGAALSRAP